MPCSGVDWSRCPSSTLHEGAPAARAAPPLGAPPEGVLNWTNRTLNMTGAGGAPQVVDAGVAFDPLGASVDLYGGLHSPGHPSNSTWVYAGAQWANETATVSPDPAKSPPAVYGMEFAWDPRWAGVILTGGELSSGLVNNQTWLLNGTGWSNITGKVSTLPDPSSSSPHSAFGVMAYDQALQELIAVNGCSSAMTSCASALVGATWALAGSGSTWTDLGTSFATPYPGTVGSGGSAAQMAYDVGLKELVYYGGADASGAAQNYTWVMSGTGWSNDTKSSVGCTTPPTTCAYYPQATSGGALTWDGQLQELVLFGGSNASDKPTNTTYLLNGSGNWRPSCPVTCGLASPPAETGGEIPSNSTEVAPLLVVGTCVGSCLGDTWVFDVSPDPSISQASPNPSEVGVPVTVDAVNSAETGSGPNLVATVFSGDAGSNVSYDNGTNNSTPFPFNGTFTYASAQIYDVYASVRDFFGLEAKSPPVAVLVNATVAVTPTAAADPGEVGTAVGFSAGIGAATGVGPFAYSWVLGDGNDSTVASPSHVYGKAGNYSVGLSVTDHLGRVATGGFTLEIFPTLHAGGTVSEGTSDVNIPITFMGSAAGGSGSYSSYRWTFGDSTTSPYRSVVHVYAETGTFHPVLQVTDSAGFTASASTTLVIHPGVTLSAIHASTDTPSTSTPVTFNLTVTQGTPPYTYAWNFGDSTASTNASPTHTFRSPGTYEVLVVVEDHVGSIASERYSITVHAPAGPSWAAWLSHGIGLYTFVGALAGAVFLGTIFLLGRRQRPEEPQAKPEGAGDGEAEGPGPEGTGGDPDGKSS